MRNSVSVSNLMLLDTPPIITWHMTNVTRLATGATCEVVLPDMTGADFIHAFDFCSSVTVTRSVPVGTSLGIGPGPGPVAALDAAGHCAWVTNWVTVVSPDLEPRDDALSTAKNSPVQISLTVRFQGIPGRAYTVQRSTDLMEWSDLAVGLADPDGLISYTDTVFPSEGAFYRVKAGLRYDGR